MAEYSANAVQTVNPGETIVFTDSPVPCTRGFVRHRDGDGNFLLSGWTPRNPNCYRSQSAVYLVDFGANVAIPTGGTVGPISVTISIEGNSLPATSMVVTPAAADQYFNISRASNIEIWKGCCQTVSIRNTSDQAILVHTANVIFTRPDLSVTY